MRVYYNNLLDGDAVAFTPTSEAAGFPVENLANDQRSNPWRTGASTATERVVIDLGSAQLVQALILLDHDILVGETITIEASATANWAAPDYTSAVTWSAGPLLLMTGNRTYQYWRLSIAKTGSAVVREIGRAFLGPFLQFGEPPDYAGFKRKPVSMTTSATSSGGQVYSSARDSSREIELSFSAFGQSDLDDVTIFYSAVDLHTSFFVVVDETASVGSEFATPMYCKLKDLPGPEVEGEDAETLYKFKLSLKEQL
jgi:hypothetical protein